MERSKHFMLSSALLLGSIVMAHATESTSNAQPVVIRAPGIEGSTWFISGSSSYDVFRAMGYAVAVDRLSQIELARQQAHGTFSELFPGIDIEVASPAAGYSDYQLQAIFESLDADHQTAPRTITASRKESPGFSMPSQT